MDTLSRWLRPVVLIIQRVFYLSLFRSSCTDVFCKNGVLRNFAKFTGKQLCQRFFFDKVAGLRPVKFLRAPFLTEQLWWLLLIISINSRCRCTSKETFRQILSNVRFYNKFPFKINLNTFFYFFLFINIQRSNYRHKVASQEFPERSEVCSRPQAKNIFDFSRQF